MGIPDWGAWALLWRLMACLSGWFLQQPSKAKYSRMNAKREAHRRTSRNGCQTSKRTSGTTTRPSSTFVMVSSTLPVTAKSFAIVERGT